MFDIFRFLTRMLSHDAMMKFFDPGPGSSSVGQKMSTSKTKVKSEFNEKDKKEVNNSRNGDGKKPKAKFITPKSASTTGSDVLKDLHFFKAKHSNSSTISRNISSPTTSEPTETASRVEKTGLTVPPRSRAARNVSKTESSNNESG